MDSEALRILIVDDHEDSAEMLSMLLNGRGHATRMALDGPTALEVAAAFLPHVGLLDLSLPGMNGYELAERLRTLPGLSGIRRAAIIRARAPHRSSRVRLFIAHDELRGYRRCR